MIRLDEEKIKARWKWCERAFVLSATPTSRLPNEAFSCPKIKTAFLPSSRGATLCYWQQRSEAPGRAGLSGSDTSVEPSIFAPRPLGQSVILHLVVASANLIFRLETWKTASSCRTCSCTAALKNMLRYQYETCARWESSFYTNCASDKKFVRVASTRVQ